MIKARRWLYYGATLYRNKVDTNQFISLCLLFTDLCNKTLSLLTRSGRGIDLIKALCLKLQKII